MKKPEDEEAQITKRNK